MAENFSEGISYLHAPLIHTVTPNLSPMPIFINKYEQPVFKEAW